MCTFVSACRANIHSLVLRVWALLFALWCGAAGMRKEEMLGRSKSAPVSAVATYSLKNIYIYIYI